MAAPARRQNRPLWAVSVTTTREAGDAVGELFQRVFGSAAAAYTDIESGRTTVSAYVNQRPDAASLRVGFRAGLARIRKCGLNTGAARVSIRRIHRADWAEVWKRHFKPIEIGRALLVKPEWSRRRARKGQATIVLNPGLGFGTGQHPTTAFCLEQLADRREALCGRTFLDIGTGSGILAIAAAKLGYAPVEAYDFDPEAVRVACANARRNRVLGRVRLHRADLTKLPARSAKKYGLICANLIAPLLIAERNRILSRLDTQGVLVIAGILKREFARVRKAFEGAGLELIAARSEREWRSGAFAFRR